MTDKCGKEQFLQSNLCELCIEDAAIRSAQNMGTPDRVMCGHCGSWFNGTGCVDDLLDHMVNEHPVEYK